MWSARSARLARPLTSRPGDRAAGPAPIRRRGRPRAIRGFTLVEVLVATAIIGFAVPSLMGNIIEQMNGIATLRERAVAQWAASNRITEIRLAHKHANEIPEGDDYGTSDMANETWHWRTVVAETAVEDFHRVDLEIRNRAERSAPVLAKVTAYLNEFTPDLPDERRR